MEKPFKNFDEQIEILVSRGLIIPDKIEFKKVLTRVTYYSLINGYKTPFLKQGTAEEEFEENTSIERIINLYNFDRELRNWLLYTLQDIEDTLFASISYNLSLCYSHEKKEYLKKTNFRPGSRFTKNSHGFKNQRDKLLYELNKICNSTDQPMLHYKKKYRNIPPWILVKGMTFGHLSHMYELSKATIKEHMISGIFEIDQSDITPELKEYFKKSIDIFRRYRNWAAHGGRTYNHYTAEKLSYYEPFYKRLNLSADEQRSGTAQNDIYALITAIVFFYQKQPKKAKHFLDGIISRLEDYKKKDPRNYLKVLDEMNLPQGFEIDLYIYIEDNTGKN